MTAESPVRQRDICQADVAALPALESLPINEICRIVCPLCKTLIEVANLAPGNEDHQTFPPGKSRFLREGCHADPSTPGGILEVPLDSATNIPMWQEGEGSLAESHARAARQREASGAAPRFKRLDSPPQD